MPQRERDGSFESLDGLLRDSELPEQARFTRELLLYYETRFHVSIRSTPQ